MSIKLRCLVFRKFKTRVNIYIQAMKNSAIDAARRENFRGIFYEKIAQTF